MRDPAAAADLRRLTIDLLLLSGRAHPIYAPIIERISAHRGAASSPEGAQARRLAELRATREDLAPADGCDRTII